MSQLSAAFDACAFADRSELGRLVGTGKDLLALLHRLSTNDVLKLQPGEGRPTVLTNAKGRIVERLFVHHLGDDGVLLVAGPGAAPRVLAHLAKFTFAEETGLADRTEATFAFALIGPRWAKAGRASGLAELAPYGAAVAELSGVRVHVLRTNGFDAEGLMVVGPAEGAGRVRAALAAAVTAEGGGELDSDEFEAWRILSARPGSGHELTEEHNPLEAGLRDAISFTKGCYVGQEVVARLNTYDKVSRTVVRFTLSAGDPVPAGGAALLHEGRAVGAVTSAILPPGRVAPVGLAYVKVRDLPAGVSAVAIDDRGTRRQASLIRA